MTTLQSSAQKQLRQLIEQIERLEEEKKALAGDIRDKYLEAKAVGFDVKALRKIVSMRKKSKTDRQEEEAILAVYMHALGMLDEELQMAGATRTTPTSWTRRSNWPTGEDWGQPIDPSSRKPRRRAEAMPGPRILKRSRSRLSMIFALYARSSNEPG